MQGSPEIREHGQKSRDGKRQTKTCNNIYKLQMRAGEIQGDDKRQINCTSPLGHSNSLREASCTLPHKKPSDRQNGLSLTQILNHYTHYSVLMTGKDEHKRKRNTK